MARTPWNKLHPDEKRRRNVERCRKYYEAHKEEHAARQKKYDSDNREHLDAKKREYYLANKEKLISQMKARAAKNRPATNARQERWRSEKRKNDPAFQLMINVRERIRFGVKHGGGVKCARSLALLGCSIERLRGFLEAQFEIGMTWENYGKWHVDHIIPLVAFDLRCPEAQKQAFHYSNLQPLWAADNIRKGDFLPDGTRGRHLTSTS